MAALTAARPRLAGLRRLARSAAARRADGVFLVEGSTLAAEASAAGLAIRQVYIETARADEEARCLGDRLAAAGATRLEVEAGALAKVGTSVTPQPLLAVVERPAAAAGGDAPAGAASFVLVAVSVADPGNAGTLLRCAEAAGAGAVIFAGESADPYGPKAVRASAGSIFRLPPALAQDPITAFEGLRGRGLRAVGAAAGRGCPFDRADLSAPLALVVGNESHGLPASLAEQIDDWVHVPLAGLAESLNVGAAAAVLCFEVQRRRRCEAPQAEAAHGR